MSARCETCVRMRRWMRSLDREVSYYEGTMDQRGEQKTVGKALAGKLYALIRRGEELLDGSLPRGRAGR